jgi:hypothetical protein
LEVHNLFICKPWKGAGHSLLALEPATSAWTGGMRSAQRRCQTGRSCVKLQSAGVGVG